MLCWERPTDWYLDQFSNDDEWKHGVDPEMATQVEDLISTTVIDAIAKELKANVCPIDHGALGNLLRHWARIELSPDKLEDDGERRKRTRDSARSLAKDMNRLKDRFDAPIADVAHNASRHVQHDLRVHYTRHLFDTLRRSLEELTPAVQALSEEKLPRGRPPESGVTVSVETLLEIFEYVTQKPAGRTYDPIQNDEVSAFSQFVRSAFEALRGDEAPETDWPVRVVLNERKERNAKLRALLPPTNLD